MTQPAARRLPGAPADGGRPSGPRDDAAVTLAAARSQACALQAAAEADRAEASEIRQRALAELARAEEILAEAEEHRARAWAEADAIRAEAERRHLELERAVEGRLLAVLELLRTGVPGDATGLIDLRDRPTADDPAEVPDELSRAVDAAMAKVLGGFSSAHPAASG